MKQKILAIGSADVYVTMNMARIPQPNEALVDNGGLIVINGGKASNTAVALSRLGAKAFLCARVGDDAYGKRLARLYNESKIDISFLEIDRNFRTGVTVNMKEQDGSERKILYRGANLNITPEDALRSMSCEPEGIYIDFELSYPITETTIKYASKHEIPTLFNASPASKSFPLSSLPRVDIFCVGEEEAHEYTGILPTSTDSALRCAVELQKSVQAKYIVIRFSDKGAFIYDGKYSNMVSSYIVRQNDTSGTEEVFCAATILEYVRNGQDVVAACKYANAAVALAVQAQGTTASMPYHEDVMAFIEKKRLN